MSCLLFIWWRNSYYISYKADCVAQYIISRNLFYTIFYYLIVIILSLFIVLLLCDWCVCIYCIIDTCDKFHIQQSLTGIGSMKCIYVNVNENIIQCCPPSWIIGFLEVYKYLMYCCGIFSSFLTYMMNAEYMISSWPTALEYTLVIPINLIYIWS